MSHFIRIVPSETASSSTFPRPLQSGSRRKLECRSEIILTRVIHPDENFDESTLQVGSPDPHNAGSLRNLPPPLLIKLSSRIPQSVESITLPDQSHISNAIMLHSRAQVVADAGRYFYMSITTIKHDDLDSYKRITTCKSCGYEDPHDPHYQLRLSDCIR